MNDLILGQDYIYRVFNGSDDDYVFVVDSWLKGYQSSPAHGFKRDPRDVKSPWHLYWKYQRDLILGLLDENKCVMICDKEGTMLGYLVYQIKDPALIIHWGYIKREFRKMGLMRNLIDNLLGMIEEPASHIILTHLSKHYAYVHGDGVVHLVKRLSDRFVYLPYYCWK